MVEPARNPDEGKPAIKKADTHQDADTHPYIRPRLWSHSVGVVRIRQSEGEINRPPSEGQHWREND